MEIPYICISARSLEGQLIFVRCLSCVNVVIFLRKTKCSNVIWCILWLLSQSGPLGGAKIVHIWPFLKKKEFFTSAHQPGNTFHRAWIPTAEGGLKWSLSVYVCIVKQILNFYWNWIKMHTWKIIQPFLPKSGGIKYSKFFFNFTENE